MDMDSWPPRTNVVVDADSGEFVWGFYTKSASLG